MSRDQRSLLDYVLHVLNAIQRIQTYTHGLTAYQFLDNVLVQDAVIRNFEVIGEACNNIEKHYPTFSKQHPEVPFAFAYEMRNALAHGYFKIDFDVVWQTIQHDLPFLYNQMLTLQQKLESTD